MHVTKMVFHISKPTTSRWNPPARRRCPCWRGVHPLIYTGTHRWREELLLYNVIGYNVIGLASCILVLVLHLCTNLAYSQPWQTLVLLQMYSCTVLKCQLKWQWTKSQKTRKRGEWNHWKEKLKATLHMGCPWPSQSLVPCHWLSVGVALCAWLLLVFLVCTPGQVSPYWVPRFQSPVGKYFHDQWHLIFSGNATVWYCLAFCCRSSWHNIMMKLIRSARAKHCQLCLCPCSTKCSLISTSKYGQEQRLCQLQSWQVENSSSRVRI